VSRKPAQIPLYASDGSPRGYRSPEAAQRLLGAGFVTAAYGRKGHIKALFLRQEDGANPVRPDLKAGTRYSYQQHLDSGRQCWKLKKLDARDDNGEPVNTRAVFLQVVQDCLAT
jgi:hypothetical protein